MIVVKFSAFIVPFTGDDNNRKYFLTFVNVAKFIFIFGSSKLILLCKNRETSVYFVFFFRT